MNQNNHVTPKFLKQFQCIGSECENTCCQDWSIIVSNKARQEIERHMSTCGQINVSNHFEQKNDGYVIKLDANKRCPFLDNKSLCQIQASNGGDVLPSVCKEFPRKNIKLGSDILLSASVACPEIARNVLLDMSAFDFEEKGSHEAVSIYYESKHVACEFALKQLAFNILGSVLFKSNEERLCALILLLNLVSQAISNQENIENLLLDFEHELNNGNILASITQYQFSETNYSLLIDMLAHPFFDLPNCIYTKYYRKFLAKLGDKHPIKNARQGYAAFSHAYSDNFCQFLRHWVYHNHFNLDSATDIYYQGATLVFQINYIRTVLGFEFLDTPKVSHSQLITDVFHSTARGYAHNKDINLIVMQKLQTLNLDSPINILSLCKF